MSPQNVNGPGNWVNSMTKLFFPHAKIEAEILDNPSIPIAVPTSDPSGVDEVMVPFTAAWKLSDIPEPNAELTATLTITSNVGSSVFYDGSVALPGGWGLSSGSSTWDETVSATATVTHSFGVTVPLGFEGFWELPVELTFDETEDADSLQYYNYIIWQTGYISNGDAVLGEPGIYRDTPEISNGGSLMFGGFDEKNMRLSASDTVMQQGCYQQWIAFSGTFSTSGEHSDQARKLRLEVHKALSNGESELVRVLLTSSSGFWGTGLLPALTAEQTPEPITYFFRLMATDTLQPNAISPPYSIKWVPMGSGIAHHGLQPTTFETEMFEAIERDINCQANPVQYVHVYSEDGLADGRDFWAASKITWDASKRLGAETDFDPQSRETGGTFQGVSISSYSPVFDAIKIDMSSPYLKEAVLHEYGHSVMDGLYEDNMPQTESECSTGHAPGDSIGPGCAWVEGWAEFFSMWVVYGDTVAGTFDLETPSGSISGSDDEGAVAASLLDIWDCNGCGAGSESHDSLALGIGDSMMELMVANQPDDIDDFGDDWCTRAENNSAFTDIVEHHGIDGCP
jgi:hypothetical protein